MSSVDLVGPITEMSPHSNFLRLVAIKRLASPVIETVYRRDLGNWFEQPQMNILVRVTGIIPF